MKISPRIGMLLLCLPMLASAATVRFQQGLNGYAGTVDTHIRFDQPTTRFPNVSIVLVDNDSPIAHGLIRFDGIFGTAPGQIPPDASIQSATLTFRTSNDSDPVWFHRMLVPWDETNNWNELSTSGAGLQADNIEMSAVPDFTFTASPPVPRVDTFDVTATVRGWLAGDFPNYGWGITNQIANGWQFDSSENSTTNNRPALTVVFEAPCHPISIVTQPGSGGANEGDPFSFSITVSGTDPVYQWFKDGAPIAEATNSTFTIKKVFRSDEGSYVVAISNSCSGPLYSANALLHVHRDIAAPSIVCGYGTNNDVTIFVMFSEVVTNASDPFNYSVFPSADPTTPLTVVAAVYPGGTNQGNMVVLTLDPTTPLVPGHAYSISAGAVFDCVGNPIDPNQVRPLSLYTSPIFNINQSKIWKFNDSGTDLGDSWKARTFDDTDWESGPALIGFETAALPEPLRTSLPFTTVRTFYFRTHFEYGTPAGEGVLRFRTVLDDAVAIYLNGAEIFRLRLPPGPLNYLTEGLTSVSDAVYEGPFTVCVTNLRTGDNVLAAEVHQTGAASSDMIFGLELFSLSGTTFECFWIKHPTNRVVSADDRVTFEAEYLCGGSTISYQWFHDDVAIPGATGLTYTIPFVRPSDEGDYYLMVTNAFGTRTSRSAHLTVLSCCAPQITSVYGTNGTIVLVFDQLTTNGLDISNFRITARDGSHELTIASTEYTTFTNTGNTLLLRLEATTPFRADTPYNLHLENIEDLYENRIEPMIIPIPLFPSMIFGLNQSWRYETSGTDLSTAWYRLNYDDTAWPIGLALFDAKRPPRAHVSGELVRTMTTLSNAAATAQIPTHYFRTRFNYAGPAANTLYIRPFLDDGAVYYLNGRELFRVGIPPLIPVQYGTLANRTLGDANFEGPYYVGVTDLVSGTNLLAVEVHQQSLTSSDLTFGTEFGLLLTMPRPRLRIALAANGSEIVLTWNGSAVLEQAGSLSPAEWSEVEGAISGHTAPLSGSKFFRLREP